MVWPFDLSEDEQESLEHPYSDNPLADLGIRAAGGVVNGIGGIAGVIGGATLLGIASPFVAPVAVIAGAIALRRGMAHPELAVKAARKIYQVTSR
ncbi:hypothetical protein ACFQ1E_15760 [Sphingomonas canadensis]|uniref:Uncharacterized protein n=1 Tax=Sphingomonas canadensis TaxID=1219257 RepID=A0ABW3H8R0_9SPHN|nr:hypothetical protein [Sphingomonas canadensis]MCW3837347.1 hypothetical protein [Sphingomonas canadensis]